MLYSVILCNSTPAICPTSSNISNLLSVADVENHGSISLQWAEAAFANSSRYNSHDTTKVLIHATNGHFTDKDYLYKMYRMPVVDAAAYTANRFIEAGENLYL